MLATLGGFVLEWLVVGFCWLYIFWKLFFSGISVLLFLFGSLLCTHILYRFRAPIMVIFPSVQGGSTAVFLFLFGSLRRILGGMMSEALIEQEDASRPQEQVWGQALYELALSLGIDGVG